MCEQVAVIGFEKSLLYEYIHVEAVSQSTLGFHFNVFVLGSPVYGIVDVAMTICGTTCVPLNMKRPAIFVIGSSIALKMFVANEYVACVISTTAPCAMTIQSFLPPSVRKLRVVDAMEVKRRMMGTPIPSEAATYVYMYEPYAVA